MSKRLNVPSALVITENPSVLYRLKKELDPHFFVIHAGKKGEALQWLRESSFDFIFLDESLEEEDPLEISRAVSNQPIPIFLITGRLSRAYRAKAKEAGVAHFVSDALDPAEIRQCTELGKRGALSQGKIAGVFPKIVAIGEEKGLKHKVVIHDRALQLLAKAKAENQSVALLLIRVDDYVEKKRVHGSRVKEEFFHFLSRSIGKNPLILPISEGKFALLVPNATQEAAEKGAKRLQSKTESHLFGTKTAFHLTVSVGFGILPLGEQSFNQLLESAKRALGKSMRFNSLIRLFERAE